MPSLYAQYIKEREGKDIIEDERGFATYSFLSDTVYVVDVYIIPEERDNGVAKEYFNKIEELAKEKELKYIMTSVDMRMPGWKNSVNRLATNKYKLYSTDANDKQFVFFRKELSYGE